MTALGDPVMLPDDLDGVRALLHSIDAELAAHGQDVSAREHRRVMEQLQRRFEQRSRALTDAHAAAATLRRITAPRELLMQAPAALCAGTGFERAMLGTIHESSLVGLAACWREDPEGAERLVEQLGTEPLRLDHRIVESDVLRRRRATLVGNVAVNARVDRRLAELLGADSYVTAPLLSGASVIGMIHADRGAREPLDVLDRDVLWEFASVLSQISESAELRRTLRQERDQLRRFLEWLNARSVSLADAPITFGAYFGQERRRTAPAAVPVETDAGRRDDRLVFGALLTRRELDVLRLLAEGSTNRTIADALVLSDATVKFHVNGILRKLRVANRAEAVARYLSLLGAAR